MKTALGRTPPLDIREVFVSVPLDKRGALVKVETELRTLRRGEFSSPSRYEGHTVDALAPGDEEGRGRLR